jgi:hypothetical protein
MGGEKANGGDQPKKQLIINAFVETCSGHQSPGLWRHPEDESWRFNDVRHWVELAQLLEKGKFHGMFIADVLVRVDLQPCARQRSRRVADFVVSVRAHMMYTRGQRTLIQLSSRERNGL